MPIFQLYFYNLRNDLRTAQDVLDAIECYTFVDEKHAYSYVVYDALCVHLDRLADQQNTQTPVLDDMAYDLASPKISLVSRYHLAKEVLFEAGYYVEVRNLYGGNDRPNNPSLLRVLGNKVWAVRENEPFEGSWEHFVR